MESTKPEGFNDEAGEFDESSLPSKSDNDKTSVSFGDDYDDFSTFTAATGDGDGDDFGKFDDFTEFSSSGDGTGFGGNGFEESNTVGDVPIPESSGLPKNPTSDKITLPCIDFSNASSQTILNQFTEIFDGLFPSSSDIQKGAKDVNAGENNEVNISPHIDTDNSDGQKPSLENDSLSSDDGDLENILKSTPESMKMWQRLAPDLDFTPFLWKQSNIRKKFYFSLGVSPETLEEDTLRQGPPLGVRRSDSIKRPSSTPSSRSSSPVPPPRPQSASTTLFAQKTLGKNNNASESKSKLSPDVDLNLAKSLCSISEATLQTYSTADLQSLKSKLLNLTRQTSDTLTYWLDQREQRVMDSETYNQMIECLVGHAQKVRKKNNKMASGLSSLSLTFKKQKYQLNSPKTPSSASTDAAAANIGSQRVFL